MQLHSLAFNDGGSIPKKYTCDASDVSPPLTWSAMPEGAKSLTLTCEDLDGDEGSRIHWLLFNLPPDMREVPESLPPQKTLANGGKHGSNDFNKIGYHGPCPNDEMHRYCFRLYALNTRMNLDHGTSYEELISAMEGHIIAEASLMGKYRREAKSR